jgi:hypothetical protein
MAHKALLPWVRWPGPKTLKIGPTPQLHQALTPGTQWRSHRELLYVEVSQRMWELLVLRTYYVVDAETASQT